MAKGPTWREDQVRKVLGGKGSSNRIRTALAHQQSLQRILMTATATSQDRGVSAQELSHAQADIQGLSNFIGSFINTKFYNEVCPEYATHLAQSVFRIPEILELVLKELGLKHLLKVQQVNRQFRDAMTGSKQLQRKLSLLPEFECHPSLLPAGNGMPGFVADIRYGYHLGSTAKVETATFQFDRKLRLGSRCRRMHFWQPPPTEMKVFVSCCVGTSTYHPPVISNASGLTVGELYDETDRLKNAHANCPFAVTQAYDKNGVVHMSVGFELIVTRKADDPTVLLRQQKEERRSEQLQQSRSLRLQMVAFTAAKRWAHTNGTPIPSFKEFEEMHKDKVW